MKRLAIIAVCMLALRAAGQFGALAVSQMGGNWWDGLGLTSVWAMDDASGTTASDSVSGNNATFSGSPVWTNLDGVVSVYFTANPQYLTAGTPANLNIRTNLTVCTWAYISPSQITTFARIIEKESIWSIITRLVTQPHFFGSGLDVTVGVAGDFPSSEWIHIAYTFDGTGIRAYVNGVYKTFTALVGLLSDDSAIPFTMGNRVTGSRQFIGAVADVAVGRNCATSNDVATIYDRSKSRYGK